jgi:hypothetical protein
MWVVGFTFVALVNLKNRNGNPFQGPEGDYVDVCKAFVFSFIFYALSGIVTLRQTHDESSYCATPARVKPIEPFYDPSYDTGFEITDDSTTVSELTLNQGFVMSSEVNYDINYEAAQNLEHPLQKLFF